MQRYIISIFRNYGFKQVNGLCDPSMKLVQTSKGPLADISCFSILDLSGDFFEISSKTGENVGKLILFYDIQLLNLFVFVSG